MREWIRSRLPTEESLNGRPGLGWLRPLLRRRALWHLNRRNVALGAGIGVFFGFLIPVAQIAGAAAFAVLLRANLPVAALATFVTNPITFGPLLLLAYQTGAAILGEPVEAAAAEAVVDGADAADAPSAAGWLEQARSIGKPLILGLGVFAVGGGISAWGLVHVTWTVAVLMKRRARLRARTGVV